MTSSDTSSSAGFADAGRHHGVVRRLDGARPRRRSLHCGHGVPVARRGDTAPDCPYCAEGIDVDDYWDMVRWQNQLHHEQERKRSKRKRVAPRLLGPWPSWPTRTSQ